MQKSEILNPPASPARPRLASGEAGELSRGRAKPETPKESRGLPTGQANPKFKIPNSKLTLLQARDKNKDQSYFLWTLTQEQLARSLFPIGEYTKPEVRELARKFGLPTAEKAESQGICFIGEIDIHEFLKGYIPERKGRVLTTAGKVVGEHCGAEFYTIGQREGIGIGGGIPYYVTGKDVRTNTLIVAEGPYDEALFRTELTATDVHWIYGEAPGFPLRCEARIRYRQPVQRCTVRCQLSGDRCQVEFDEPQRAITPGQSVVFYKSNPLDAAQGVEMLGGAVIA
jgi:tRNA-specific 2-thiouridylase